MTLTIHVLNFNNKIPTSVVFFDTKNASVSVCNRTCYINELNWNFQPFSSYVLIYVFRNENSVSVEGEISTRRDTRAGVPQVSVLLPHHQLVQTNVVNLALFAVATYLYGTLSKECYVLSKFQRVLDSMAA
jgi:hypothetical protein